MARWRATTSAGGDGASGLDIALDGAGKFAGSSASFAGQLAADGAVTGNVALRGRDLSLLFPAPAIPLKLEGRLSLAGGSLIARDLLLDLGGAPARADLALHVAPHPSLDLALSVTRLDAAAWLPVALRAGTQTSLPIGLDVSAGTATLIGGTLQHLHVAADLSPSQITLKAVSAQLPGDATLYLSGSLVRLDPQQPRFDGEVKLAAPALRTTLLWLGNAGLPRFDTLPAGVLESLELGAHIAASDQLTLSSLHGSIDNTAVSGGVALKPGSPSVLTADLRLDRLDLDRWLAGGPPGLAATQAVIASFDTTLRLQANTIMLRGLPIHAVSLDAATAAGYLALRRLDATLQGVHLIASGNLSDGGRITDGQLQAATQDASPLAELLPLRWRATPALWRGPASLQAEFAGPTGALAVRTNLKVADARVDWRPLIDLGSGKWNGQITLRHPGARRLITTLGVLAMAGLTERPGWPGEGSLALTSQLSYAPGHLTADSFDLTAGGLHAGGQLAVDTTGPEPRVTGRIAADTLPLPLPVLQQEVPLPLGLLRGWQASLRLSADQVLAELSPIADHATAKLELADGKLVLDQLRARMADGAATASATLDGAAMPPSLAFRGTLAGAHIDRPPSDLPLDLAAGQADLSLDVTATGYSAATLLATMNGDLHLTVTDGTLAGFDMFRIKHELAAASRAAELRDALASGSTGFDRLDVAASIAHGNLTLDSATLSGAAGDASFTGSLGLADGMLDLRIATRPAIPDAPEIAERLNGPLGDPHRTPELARLARWLAEHGQASTPPR